MLGGLVGAGIAGLGLLGWVALLPATYHSTAAILVPASASGSPADQRSLALLAREASSDALRSDLSERATVNLTDYTISAAVHDGTGVIVTARGPSAGGAQEIADLAASALVDHQRVVLVDEKLVEAANLQTALKAADQRIAEARSNPDVGYAGVLALLAERGQLAAQKTSLEIAASATTTSAPRVIQAASLATRPEHLPAPFTSSVILVGGLAAGTSIATIRGSRLTSADRVRATGIPVLTRDPAGASNMGPPPVGAILEALAADRYGTSNDRRVLALAPIGREALDCTLALEIATSLADEGGRVLLIDASCPAGGRPLSGDFRHDLFDVVRHKMSLGDALQPVGDSLWVLAANGTEGEAVRIREIRELVDALLDGFEAIVIDAPPAPADLTYLAAADVALLTVSPRRTRTVDLRATLDAVNALRTRVIGAVLTPVGAVPSPPALSPRQER